MWTIIIFVACGTVSFHFARNTVQLVLYPRINLRMVVLMEEVLKVCRCKLDPAVEEKFHFLIIGLNFFRIFDFCTFVMACCGIIIL